MFYFITKTGLPMFDACRAYGLALILDRLAIEVGVIEQICIEDAGSFYRLEGPSVNTLLSVPPHGLFDDLLTPSNGWCGVLLTTIARSPNVDRVKDKSREKLQEEIRIVQKTVEKVNTWLPIFEQPGPCIIKTSGGQGFKTLPLSLEVVAARGIRRLKLDGYSEGEQIYVPEVQWALALLGGATFIRGTWAGGNYVDLLPFHIFKFDK